MSKEYKNILYQWFEEVWNEGRGEAIDKLAASHVVAHGLVDGQGNAITNREEFKAFWYRFRSALPDVRVHVEGGVTEADLAVVRCTVCGTHTGEGIGLKATQKPVTFTGMCMARIENGQIVEVWNSFDFLTFYQQLGILPAGCAAQ
jgi:steroid delta-isomerase-like uncharacterized protein